MKRKEFLNLSTRAALLLGIAPAVSCSQTQNEKDLDVIQQKLNALLDKTGTGSAFSLTAPKIEKVRIGIIGSGNRGAVLIQMFDWLIQNSHAKVVAISDLKQDKVEKLNEHLKKVQPNGADLYYGNENEWKKVVERDDVDLLVIATPWELHTPMALYGMEKGKHVASEVPISYSLEDCWKIIETAERTQKHCMMMENCCFNGEELWILNMINQGIFGNLTHAEGAYIHDLRMHMLHETYYEDQWRLKHHAKRNGNFYTTHGLGPVSQYMDIGRGDTYDYLTSMSSLEQSLSEAAKAKNHPIQKFNCGDMNTTMIKTKLVPIRRQRKPMSPQWIFPTSAKLH